MRTSTWLLVVTLLLAATVAALAILPGADDDVSRPHPEIDAMRVGGARPTGIELVLGWLFGLLQILLFALFVRLGARRRPSLTRPLVAATTIYLIAWTALIAVFARGDPEAIGFAGFAPATLVLLFALWPAPVGLVVLYAAGFQRWVFGPDEEARFRELARQAPKEAGDGLG